MLIFPEEDKKILINSENSSSYGNEKGYAKVEFYTHSEKLLYENQYPFNTSIKEIIKDFLSKNSDKITLNSLQINNLAFVLKNSQIYEKIDVDQKCIEFYLTRIQDTTLMIMEAGKHINSNGSSTTTIPVKSRYLKIYVQNEKRFNHISKNMEDYIIEKTYLIGKPIINELKYYIFNKRTKESKIIKCTKDDFNKLNIKYFSRMSVYCNAKNFLYVYECNDNPNIFNNNYGYNCNYDNNSKFFEINLITHKIELISLKFPKRILHSMIFIPECYIFIVGGKDTKKVLVYKIRPDNEVYEEYPHLLPNQLLEPSLITINDKYLYAFENSSVRFQIVRTNILLVTPFEEIKINDLISINQKFFGLIKFEHKNSILFLGGQILNLPHCKTKNCFEFDYNINKLTLSEREFQNFDLIEKTFIPMEKNIYMQIAELKFENKYIQKVLLFYTQIDNNLNESISKEYKEVKKKGRFREGGFQSIDSGNIKITVAPNIISLCATSSYGEIGEMPVPLYNNA